MFHDTAVRVSPAARLRSDAKLLERVLAGIAARAKKGLIFGSDAGDVVKENLRLGDVFNTAHIVSALAQSQDKVLSGFLELHHSGSSYQGGAVYRVTDKLHERLANCASVSSRVAREPQRELPVKLRACSEEQNKQAPEPKGTSAASVVRPSSRLGPTARLRSNHELLRLVLREILAKEKNGFVFGDDVGQILTERLGLGGTCANRLVHELSKGGDDVLAGLLKRRGVKPSYGSSGTYTITPKLRAFLESGVSRSSSGSAIKSTAGRKPRP